MSDDPNLIFGPAPSVAKIRARRNAGLKVMAPDWDWLLAEHERLTAEASRLWDLVADFVDGEPCQLDHHGHCQTHRWLYADLACPHARARELAQTPKDGDHA